MFKKKEEKENKFVHLYYFYKKIQRWLLAIAVLINVIFVIFVVNEGNLAILILFALNLYVAGWAYFEFMRDMKKHKEKNPDVK